MEQINAARTAMLHRGVPKPWLQETWNDEWVWSAEQFKELRKIRFKNADGLRYRLAAMKTDRALDKAALEAARAQQKKSATPTEPTPAAPIEPVAATASAAYRKRLASATFLPTPSPSVESSPEPSSASNPSLPSQPKKPKATLTPAQEAAKLAREQASLVKWNKEFDLTQATWLRAQKEGGAAFLSLDVEMWEWDARCLLEFGWSVTEFIKEDDGSVMERRDDQHISELRLAGGGELGADVFLPQSSMSIYSVETNATCATLVMYAHSTPLSGFKTNSASTSSTSTLARRSDFRSTRPTTSSTPLSRPFPPTNPSSSSSTIHAPTFALCTPSALTTTPSPGRSLLLLPRRTRQYPGKASSCAIRRRSIQLGPVCPCKRGWANAAWRWM